MRSSLFRRSMSWFVRNPLLPQSAPGLRLKTKALFTSCFLISILPAWVAGSVAEQAVYTNQSASALLDRAYDNLYGDDFVETIRISTQYPNDRSFTRRLQVTRKESGGRSQALIRFLEPGDIRKTAVLILENESRSDDVFIYLPALRTIRRVKTRSESFFGTDITFEDLEPKNVDEYEVRYVEVDQSQDQPCVLIETKPKHDEEASYDRVLWCIDPQRAVVLWSEFFKGQERIKRLEIDPASIRKVKHKLLPHRATMRTFGKGTKSVMEVEEVNLDVDIPDTLFSIPNLEMGNPGGDRRKSERQSE